MMGLATIFLGMLEAVEAVVLAETFPDAEAVGAASEAAAVDCFFIP